MPRPFKRKRIFSNPSTTLFKPAGVPNFQLEIVYLTHEEFEALRLKDYLNLDQNESAEKMNISQPTFHRLLTNARKKVSDALINGKGIEILKNQNINEDFKN